MNIIITIIYFSKNKPSFISNDILFRKNIDTNNTQYNNKRLKPNRYIIQLLKQFNLYYNIINTLLLKLKDKYCIHQSILIY
jgi:hypothetical protein